MTENPLMKTGLLLTGAGDVLNKTKSQDNLDPHEASEVRCDLCSYEWIAVRPVGLDKLECPNCGNVSYFENIPD